jgi:hypothetical protein
MTNDSTRVLHRPPRARPRPAAGLAAAIVGIAVVGMLAAACGGSPSSAGPGGSGGSPSAGASAGSPSAVAYSGCMRSHGVPNFPDPTSGGDVAKGDAQEFGVSSTEYHAAQTACQHLYPATGGSIQQCYATGDCPPAVVQQALTLMRKYARCLRAHGVPDWPDPAIGPEGRPYFDVSAVGITHQFTHSSSFESKDSVCERQVGGSAGVPVPLG